MSVEVPRSIVLVRHAKADWPDMADHERPLADRGRKDAAAVGEWLAAQGFSPGLALCSTATRTRETWKLAAPKLAHRPKTVYEERLYEASPGEIIAVLNEVPDDVRDVLLVGHNPGVQGVAETLAGSGEGDALERMAKNGFSTATLAVLRFDGTWKSVEPGAGILTEYWSAHA